jgi:ArsR family transcriptional regulator
MSSLISFFNAMSDETRLRIMVLLSQSELCVCQICGVLNLSQPKVSKHLAKLRDLGFVTDVRKEKFVFYSRNINDGSITNLLEQIISNIDHYPQLKIDHERLAERDVYFRQCKSQSHD